MTKVKTFQILLLLLSVARATSAPDLKIEISDLPEWQQPIVAMVEFDAQIRTISQLIKTDVSKSESPAFMVFTATAKENLGKRLLWVDAEAELSNGKIMTLKKISFGLLSKGIEADIRKLGGVDVDFKFPDEGKRTDPETLFVKRLRILSAAFK